MGKTLDRRAADPDMNPSWKLHDSFETYDIKNWGKGYFGINKLGHVTVHPDKNPERSIDLKVLVDDLKDRGIQAPVLLRFTDILKHRIDEIAAAFRKAMDDYEYSGVYSCVYPITASGSRPAASPNSSPCSPSPTAPRTRPSSATGSRTTSTSRWW